MITSDFHMHTAFSSDSEEPMENQVLASIRLGLTDICITDHYDYDFPTDVPEGPFIYEVPSQFAEMKRLRELYKDKITVHYGIEMGLVETGYEVYRQMLKDYPFDFNIASLHIVDRMDPYFKNYWESYESEEAALRRYLEVTLMHIKNFKDYDVLGHMDYVFRVAPTEKHYSYKKYGDIMDEILKNVIEDDKTLEVNTAGYKYKLGVPNPQPEVLYRYRELGGEHISVGSDAHATNQLAYDYASAEALLREVGFEYITIFDKHNKIHYRF